MRAGKDLILLTASICLCSYMTISGLKYYSKIIYKNTKIHIIQVIPKIKDLRF